MRPEGPRLPIANERTIWRANSPPAVLAQVRSSRVSVWTLTATRPCWTDPHSSSTASAVAPTRMVSSSLWLSALVPCRSTRSRPRASPPVGVRRSRSRSWAAALACAPPAPPRGSDCRIPHAARAGPRRAAREFQMLDDCVQRARQARPQRGAAPWNPPPPPLSRAMLHLDCRSLENFPAACTRTRWMTLNAFLPPFMFQSAPQHAGRSTTTSFVSIRSPARGEIHCLRPRCGTFQSAPQHAGRST